MNLEWDAQELIKAKHWNEIARHIEYDLITNRVLYEHSYDTMHCCRSGNNNPDDFERGVKAALGLIRQRVHSMNPS